MVIDPFSCMYFFGMYIVVELSYLFLFTISIWEGSIQITTEEGGRSGQGSFLKMYLKTPK